MSQVKLTADSGGGTTSLKGPSATTGNADVVLKLPVADGSANQVLKTDGSGQLSFTSNAGTTINNNADNRVITGSGTANTLEGEANLTFNGTALGLTGYADVRTGSSINTNATGSGASGTLHKNTTSGEFAVVSGGTGGNNYLTFYTSASAAPTERLRIDASGIVYVGGVGASATAGTLFFNDTSANGSKIAQVNGSSALTFHTGASQPERLRIDSSGKVGIGTTSPNRTLTVQSNGGQMSINDTDNTNGGIFCNAGNFALYARGNSNLGDGSVGGVFSVQTHTAGGSTAERLRIDGSGNLFLGATSYGGGGSSPKFYVSTTSDRAVKIHNTNSATSSVQITNAATGQGDDNGMQLAALSNGECMIANAEAERILIQSQENDNNKPVVNFIKPQGPSNATTVMIAFETGNQGRGAVLSSSSDGGSPSFTNLSDYRIKTNIRNYTDGYNNIKAMPVKLFDMTSDGTKDIKGWIAHEVQDYIPEAVMGDKDAVDSNGKPILQQLSYGLFMPDVVGALQTAIAKIEALEAKVAALEAA